MPNVSALRQSLCLCSGVQRQVVPSADSNNEAGAIPESTASVNIPDIQLGKVRSVIAGLLPAGHPTLAEVAEQLDVSPRTLQRRLADNDLTHSQLVKQTRLTKACQLLAQQDVRICEIALETGFASPSAFSRAFQSWTGSSPRTFRYGLRGF